MKRKIAIFLMICLILSGCTPSKGKETKEPETPVASTLMDSAEKIGSLGNLSCLPNTEIEEMSPSEMLLFGNALLLWSNIITDNGCSTEIKLISLEDGKLIGELAMPSSAFVTIQTDDNRIGICDCEMSTVCILDNTLDEINTYQLESRGDNWYLGSDLNILYQIDWENGVFAMDLTTGTSKNLLSSATDIYVRSFTKDYVALSYTDLTTQRTTCRMLDLRTGLLEPLPVDFDTVSVVCSDDVWLIGDSFQWGTYYVIADDQKKIALWQENRFDLLLPEKHLLAVDSSGLTMSLYDTDGSFISKCQVPDDQASYIGANLVWSDVWKGYFFLGMQEEACKLMFWDIGAPTSGDDFLLHEEIKKDATNVDAALRDRAEELSDHFGVEILIGDQCALEYPMFSAYEMSDPQCISIALDILEKALSKYPEGYFEQLRYGNVRTINFELVGGLSPTDTSVYNGSYSGISTEQYDRYTVVLDINMMSETNIHHEVTHITDSRLTWDATFREDALFSEEEWNKLLPKGFSYAQTYHDLTDNDIWDYVNSGYFVNDYACRYATEDRATMMEMAIMEDLYIYETNPHLLDKLAYYSKCIRDCFDTDGWPKTTAWEKMLSLAEN